MTKSSQDNSHNKSDKLFYPIILGFLIFVMIVGISVYGYIQYYQDKIYPGVKVASFDVGGFDKLKALDVIQSRIDKLESVGIMIENTDEGEKTVRYGDLGISFDKDKTYTDAYQFARENNNMLLQAKDVFLALFKDINVSLAMDIDMEKTKEVLNKMAVSRVKMSENAYFELKDDRIEIVKDKSGEEVDFEKFMDDLKQIVNSRNIHGKVVLVIREKEADVVFEDLKHLTDKIENEIQKNIVFKSTQLTYSPSKEDVVKWFKIVKRSKAQLEICEDGVAHYVNLMAQKIDKHPVDEKVNSETGEIISKGSDGYTLDKDQVVLDIKQALEEGNQQVVINLHIREEKKKQIMIKPKKQDDAGGTPGLAEGRYIEVNLSRQKLYLYEGDDFVAQYTVSTGAWDTPTPVGTRSIGSKNPRAWSAKFGLYMPYWMDIGGGYGIHELPEWPGGYKEGESHLGTPVSHGCIRLGVGAAGHVYDWAPIGTPVFIRN
jgi:nitrate reductase NapAB chaperone NapD